MNHGIELTTFGPEGRLFSWAVIGPDEQTQLSSAGHSLEGLAEHAVQSAKMKCLRGCGNCALRAKVYPANEGSKSVEIECPDKACSADNGDPLVIMASGLLVDKARESGIRPNAIDDISTQIGGAIAETY